MIDFTAMQLAKDPERKEVWLNFNDTDGFRTGLVYNFEDDNYTWADASYPNPESTSCGDIDSFLEVKQIDNQGMVCLFPTTVEEGPVWQFATVVGNVPYNIDATGVNDGYGATLRAAYADAPVAPHSCNPDDGFYVHNFFGGSGIKTVSTRTIVSGTPFEPFSVWAEVSPSSEGATMGVSGTWIFSTASTNTSNQENVWWYINTRSGFPDSVYIRIGDDDANTIILPLDNTQFVHGEWYELAVEIKDMYWDGWSTNPEASSPSVGTLGGTIRVKLGYFDQTVTVEPKNPNPDTPYYKINSGNLPYYYSAVPSNSTILFGGYIGMWVARAAFWEPSGDTSEYSRVYQGSVNPAPALEEVPCMKHGFQAGWSTKWETPDFSILRWSDFDNALAPWSSDRPPTWADMAGGGEVRDMQWLTTDGLYSADKVVHTDGIKHYYVERTGIDFDDLVQEWTTNNWKHIRQFYFHLESDLPASAVLPNPFNITAGWATNLMDTPDWLPTSTINLQNTAYDGKVKWDFRSTGRYLGLRMDFDETQRFTMTGGDVDAEQAHGR